MPPAPCVGIRAGDPPHAQDLPAELAVLHDAQALPAELAVLQDEQALPAELAVPSESRSLNLPHPDSLLRTLRPFFLPVLPLLNKASLTHSSFE